jgi:hypothetical protein
MIPPRFATHVVLPLARLFDKPSLTPLNEAARRVYMSLLIPALNLYIDEGLETRHSVTGGSRFNIFTSDIDLRVVVPGADEDRFAKIRRRVARCRRVMPFLGELETYTTEEKARVDYWMNVADPLYEILRHFRKLGWMRGAKFAPPSEYHAFKAHRAEGITHLKLAADLSDPAGALDNSIRKHFADSWAELEKISARFKELAACALASKKIKCPYLSWTISFGPASKAYDIEAAEFTVPIALLVLALSPVCLRGDNEIDEAVAQVRAIPQVSRAWRALSEIELLIARAFGRGQIETLAWLPPWIGELESAVIACRAATPEETGEAGRR